MIIFHLFYIDTDECLSSPCQMELALIKSTLTRATAPQDTLGENVKQVPNHNINYK